MFFSSTSRGIENYYSFCFWHPIPIMFFFLQAAFQRSFLTMGSNWKTCLTLVNNCTLEPLVNNCKFDLLVNNWTFDPLVNTIEPVLTSTFVQRLAWTLANLIFKKLSLNKDQLWTKANFLNPKAGRSTQVWL